MDSVTAEVNEWQKGNSKLVMSVAAGRKEARRLRTSYACCAGVKERLFSMRSTKSTHLPCVCTSAVDPRCPREAAPVSCAVPCLWYDKITKGIISNFRSLSFKLLDNEQ
jgi:hypothetical protein